ncbi:putative ADP-ribosyl glycohydrolase [Cafeteria roenbergensis virus]|uniref:Putative ADP-ribosyl glycohydrolase n=1 Tax=Cafeteria roenbergensis virus (strain BV-PW1) TaxID=693272 RepID=E3T4U1_CROVB|nr:putative ADP-ribosyl glycohydrolase [Cafeteria roenbergensis virus BV-PW1]ADO67204.1 putative ADP-ribosyl glycohydrolase [Cafeteria roenbergensis virus BV-PW1]
MVCASYCDTIGFKNSEWEFNYGMELQTLDQFYIATNTILENYIYLGGRNMDISKLIASDDTILLLATIKGIKLQNHRQAIMDYRHLLVEDKRFSGINTLEQLKWIDKHPDKFVLYNEKAGGNGAAIRTAPIGIVYDDIGQVIYNSLFNSVQTHNQVLGYLGGISVACITFFAKNKIKPTEWFTELIKLEEMKKIDHVIENSNYPDKQKYVLGKDSFWNKIMDYNEFRMPKILKRNFEKNIDRYRYLLRLLRPNYINSKFVHLGASGLEAVILSYEAIMLSYNEKEDLIDFEKLLYYGVLHFGDNDSTGAIVGAWYAAYHKTIPKNIQINKLEFIDEINQNISEL